MQTTTNLSGFMPYCCRPRAFGRSVLKVLEPDSFNRTDMKTIGISWSDKDRTPAEVKVSGHTSGPWHFDGDYICAPIPNHAYNGYWLIADLVKHRFGASDNRPQDDQREANARLIAKAPTMHELLTLILAEVETECTCNASRDKCLYCRIKECLEGK